MSSSNDTILNEAKTLNWISVQLIIWPTSIFFIFGVIGYLLNIYVFIQPALRRNSCSMYFLSSTITGLIFLLVSVPFRLLQFGFNIDPTYYILEFCKIEYYITFSTRALTSWFLVLACMDRYLCTSSNNSVRQWSSCKVASRIIPLTILVVLTIYIHVPIFYKINATSPICAGQAGFYRIFLGIWHVTVYGSGPPFFMFIFSFLTIRRVKHRRIIPAVTQLNTNAGHSNKDNHLLRMALVQCLCIGLTTSLFSISQVYISLSVSQVKNNLQIAKENLIIILGGVISTGGHCATFYLYTMTSKMFRQHLFRRRHIGS